MALKTKMQWKSGCDYYLLSYEHFYLPNLLSKIGLKRCFLPQHLECRSGPTASVTSLKGFWNEGPDQARQGKRISSKTYAVYATYRPFPKPEKWLIFGILAKGGLHENFLESFNSTNG